MNSLTVDCPDETSTIKVAEKVAAQLKPGDIIELSGDVGAGKTTFVKGLALGLNSKDPVSSPSFALKNVYQGRLKLYHFDLYRLEESGLIMHEIEESIQDHNSIVAIEWAGIAESVLPAKRISVEFSLTGEHSRRLKLSFPDNNTKGKK